jgi:AcrR family transcriptional regulator
LSPEGEGGAGPTLGLRERKKAKTRAAIRQHAMRLFREHGYEATTVEQIAEAAEVSPSTFFRYFPTKEDVVLTDEYDPLIVTAFKAQPSELHPVAALRGAMRSVFAELPDEQLAQERERQALIMSVPELRAGSLDSLAQTVQLLAEVVAERAGRRPDDLAVRALAGAVIGVGLAALLAAADDPTAEPFALLDDAMAYLEAGLPL